MEYITAFYFGLFKALLSFAATIIPGSVLGYVVDLFFSFFYPFLSFFSLFFFLIYFLDLDFSFTIFLVYRDMVEMQLHFFFWILVFWKLTTDLTTDNFGIASLESNVSLHVVGICLIFYGTNSALVQLN